MHPHTRIVEILLRVAPQIVECPLLPGYRMVYPLLMFSRIRAAVWLLFQPLDIRLQPVFLELCSIVRSKQFWVHK